MTTIVCFTDPATGAQLCIRQTVSCTPPSLWNGSACVLPGTAPPQSCPAGQIPIGGTPEGYLVCGPVVTPPAPAPNPGGPLCVGALCPPPPPPVVQCNATVAYTSTGDNAQIVATTQDPACTADAAIIAFAFLIGRLARP